MAYKPQDHYFKKAKDLNYLARSVFKLEEIQKKFHILRPGQKILDLGASPGSWSQYAAKVMGAKGEIIGLDITPIDIKVPGARFFVQDLLDPDLYIKMQELGILFEYDIVMSDMAPKTTGIKMTDQARSMELCMMALNVSLRVLKKDGHFVCKLFHSDAFTEIRDEIKKHFKRFESIKPESTRKISKEIFLVGLGKKESPLLK